MTELITLNIHSAGKNFLKGKTYRPMNTYPSRPNLVFSTQQDYASRKRTLALRLQTRRLVK